MMKIIYPIVCSRFVADMWCMGQKIKGCKDQKIDIRNKGAKIHRIFTLLDIRFSENR